MDVALEDIGCGDVDGRQQGSHSRPRCSSPSSLGRAPSKSIARAPGAPPRRSRSSSPRAASRANSVSRRLVALSASMACTLRTAIPASSAASCWVSRRWRRRTAMAWPRSATASAASCITFFPWRWSAVDLHDTAYAHRVDLTESSMCTIVRVRRTTATGLSSPPHPNVDAAAPTSHRRRRWATRRRTDRPIQGGSPSCSGRRHPHGRWQMTSAAVSRSRPASTPGPKLSPLAPAQITRCCGRSAGGPQSAGGVGPNSTTEEVP